MNPSTPDNIETPILWRWLDGSGLDSARLTALALGWRLAGTAIFLHETSPCRLEYEITLNPKWQTQTARVVGWFGTQTIQADLRVGRAADDVPHWWLNGLAVPEVTGCIDIDLDFSPSTNLLAIRRLNLAMGQSAALSAAWLRFPSLTLVPLRQVYSRTGPSTYHYSSNGDAFTTDLTVNPLGFVIDYPPFWRQILE